MTGADQIENLKAIAIINADSGTMRNTDATAFATHLSQKFEAAGRTCNTDIVAGKQAGNALKNAAASSETDAIIAVGGDGTISGAAELAYKHNKVLGVIPAGTMNLYAQTLGMPADIYAAADVLAEANIRDADIGIANGQPFVHQFSVGLQPRVVVERGKLGYESRWSKMLASLRAAFQAFSHPPSFSAEIRLPDQEIADRFSVIAISNNAYGEGHLPFADALDSGKLGIYLARVLTAVENTQLAGDLISGHWRHNPQLQTLESQMVTLRFPRLKRSAKAVIDGELIALEREVKIEILPRALKVLTPK